MCLMGKFINKINGNQYFTIQTHKSHYKQTYTMSHISNGRHFNHKCHHHSYLLVFILLGKRATITAKCLVLHNANAIIKLIEPLRSEQ